MNFFNWFCSLFNKPVSPSEMLNTGFIPSPDDPRDIQMAAAAPDAAVPVTFFKTDTVSVPAPFQKFQPACIAHAVTWYVMWLHWKKTGKYVKLSPRFLYALCKANDGLPNTEGTFYRVALSIAKYTGICEDIYFPNDVNLDKNVYKDATLIPMAAHTNAKQYRIIGYSRVMDTSFMGLFNAAYHNALCLVGMRVSSEWWEREDGTITWAADDLMPLRVPDAAHPTVSGHAVCIYASGLINQFIMNWWSTSWGYNGHGWYRKDEIPEVYEAWVITGLQ